MARLKKGRFISFEGTEGAGKSTLVRALEKALKKQGKKVLVTREPGGPPLSENIRDLILHHSMSARTELFLYEAARAEHLDKVILPALRKGYFVLCDRFTDSTLAYQAFARGLSWSWVQSLNDWASFGRKTDLSVFLDLDPEIGLKRAKDRNRFEKEGLRFQKRVRSGFLKSIRENPKRWEVIRVKNQSVDELCAIVLKRILSR